MIIALEGLPCSYKTSAVNYFADTKNIDTIGEFVIDENTPITPEACVINDIKKSEIVRAGSMSAHKIVLMDRSYISTLVYEHTASEKRGSKIDERYNELLARGELIQPDVIIYLDITAETCIKKANLSGRYNSAYEWFKKPDLARGHYRRILSEYSRQVETIKVDDADYVTAMGLITETIVGLEFGNHD